MKAIKKLFFSLSNKVLLYGDWAKNLMLNEGFKSEKLMTIYNSLDLDNQIIIRQSLKETFIYRKYFKNQYPVLLFIGRIQSVKKIDLLIEALKRLNDNNSFCNLMLIGEESTETNLNKLVSDYGLGENVWFYGPSYDEPVLGELIYNASVCVSPGNVGLTAIHCLVYGTPVITHNNFSNQGPEFEAIEQGTTGDFFIENSIYDLCKKIDYWISLNNEQRKIVRERCYEVINKRYNPKVQINILKEALNLPLIFKN